MCMHILRTGMGDLSRWERSRVESQQDRPGVRRVARARQNGEHRDHRSRKVLIFDGKFYLNFTRFCLHFDGKRVFVTETNILLLTI